MNSILRKLNLISRTSCSINKLFYPNINAAFYRQIHLLSCKYPSSTSCNCDGFVYGVAVPIRFKSNKRGNRSNTESDDEDESDAEDFRQGDKSDKSLSTLKVQTLRMDTILSVGLGLSKNKIEKLFYKSKIRVNGKKIAKKSLDINDNAEIDLIHGTEDNEDLLSVGRIEILSKKFDIKSGYFVLTVRKFKKLTIENYPGSNRYSRTSDD